MPTLTAEPFCEQIDTGRRFYPVELVESLLDGMAMMKMNVMHMFLSELCFRVESKVVTDY